MGVSSVTGPGRLPPPLITGRGYSVILLVDDKARHQMTGEDFRKADYVLTTDGKYLKTRDGTHPVVLNNANITAPSKKNKYRSIDDA